MSQNVPYLHDESFQIGTVKKFTHKSEGFGPRADLNSIAIESQLGVGKASLPLVLTAAVGVRNVALFVRLKEDDLTNALIDVDTEWQIGKICEFNYQASHPSSFQRSGIYQ
jgi:hypothetical protein